MYVEGFVVAVPKENKSLYLAQAKSVGSKFKEWGANRIVECWQHDVPHGKIPIFTARLKQRKTKK